jgi:hypothetical protein
MYEYDAAGALSSLFGEAIDGCSVELIDIQHID